MICYTAFGKAFGEENATKLSASIERMTPKPFGVGVFQIEDGTGFWEIGAYFTKKPNLLELSILETVFDIHFTVSKVTDKDWVAQVNRQLTPVYAGRFVVFGSHDKKSISINAKGLCIEAATAFGTGHHDTTVGCLLALNSLVKLDYKFKNIVDVGCGTGVLAMAAASVYSCQVLASDIDSVAVRTARTNFAKNGFGNRISLFRSRGFENYSLMERAPFDLILANILANPLCRLAKDIYKFCRTSGIIVLSGILNVQSTRVENYYRSCGFCRLFIRQIGEWTTIVMIKK